MLSPKKKVASSFKLQENLKHCHYLFIMMKI